MLFANQQMKIVLATEPVDLRKSFNGLYLAACSTLEVVPEEGAVCVFTNRGRSRIKIFCFDGTGCWVSTKRLVKGTFSWPQEVQGRSKLILKPEAFSLLLDGVDLRGAELRPWYQR